MAAITNDARRRVAAAVSELGTEITSFASDLVREESTQGNEAGAQELVADRMCDYGLSPRFLYAHEVDGLRDHPEYSPTGEPYDGRPNVVATLEGSGDGRSLLFNGHVDVVPAGDESQWSFDPFGGDVVDGVLRGRGASDMKGGVAALVSSVAVLERAGIRLDGDLTLVTVIEEEAGGYGGTLPTVLDGVTADAAVIPEPTDFDMWIANDGVSYFRVTVEGEGAHAAQTDDGVNAIGKMYPIYRALESLHDERKTTVHDELFESWHENTVSLNPGVLRAGEWPSSVPDEAVLEGRVSHAPSETRAEIHAAVEGAVEEAAEGDPWFDEHPPDVEWFGWRGSSAKVDADAPIVETIRDVVAGSTGGDSRAKGFPGGIDSRFYVNYAATPAVCFGPNAHNIHGTDECLPVEELFEVTEALSLVAMEWCGYEVVE
ncbi:MAG: ArgE/DapE family deacylase [Salinigranum sp.]